MIFRNNLSKYLLATVSAGAMMLNTSAFANPDGATVIVGDVDIAGIGTSHVIIDNNTIRSVVDWDQFSIGTGEITTINQISGDAAILNRVTGGNVTEIFGTLESNGQVFLINENGILIGESGIVETNGVVLSTLNVSNSDFLGAGDMIFSQGIEVGGGIEIHGKIRSISGGDIFILSREITIGETGEIDANGGYVGLGAGEEILLKPIDSGEGRISIRAGKGKIVNRGTVAGVVAELKAAGGNEYALAINNSGVVRARGYSKKGGKILLGGGGKVRNTGKLLARKKVIIRSTKAIQNSGLVKAGNGNKGGEIIFEAPEIIVENGSLLDVSGALGGGRVFVGGGYQGSAYGHDGAAVDISENATNVIIESGAIISADATVSGDAGDVVIWSDDSTVFAGTVTASAVDGAGGDAEISGKHTLNLAGFTVDLAGSQGGGTLLLDPDDILVSAAGGSNTATGVNVILDDDIETLLNAGTNVTILTGGAVGASTVAGYANGGGGGAGDINFEAGTRILWSENNDDNALFTVSAANDINALDDVIIQNSGDGSVDNVNEGGIRFFAGRDINIGNAAATAGTAIGSEYGVTLLIAGRSDGGTSTVFSVPDQAGEVNLIGGITDDAFAQIGYQQDATNSDATRVNGSIAVFAGGSVNMTGGAGYGSFAQIGHGGYLLGNDTVADISGSIEVRVSLAVDGDLNMNATQAASTALGSHVQIGHGGVLSGGQDQHVLGEIAGSIDVYVDRGDVNMNTAFVAGSDSNDDQQIAQIGHGGYSAHVSNGFGGVEVTHGAISGVIIVNAGSVSDGVINMGSEIAASATEDRFSVRTQIGHGAHTQLIYAGQVVTGDNSLDVTYGDVSGSITVTGAEINIIAKESVENSSGTSGQVIDNSQISQIGHGMVTTGTNFVGKIGTVVSVDGTASVSSTDAQIDVYTTLQDLLDAVDAGAINLDVELGIEQDTVDLGGPEGDEDVFNAPGFGNVVIRDGAMYNATTGAIYEGPVTIDGVTTTVPTAVPDTTTAVLVGTDGDTVTANEAQRAALDALILAATTTTPLMGADDPSNGQLNISVTERRISGDITVTDNKQGMTGGITLDAGIAGTLTSTTHDVMITRIGHATQSSLTSQDGDTSFNGGNITIRQAHIYAANIDVETQGNYDDNQDIILNTSIVAGLASVEDNTVVAQIGHSGDIFARTGLGGDADQGAGVDGLDANAADGGDITIYKGTIWDGDIVRDVDGDNGGDSFTEGGTEITVTSSNQIKILSDTAAALAPALRNNAESQIGHGHKIRLDTGDGGNGGDLGRNGGAGGDILIVQSLDRREYGIDNDSYDEYATGIRGNITLTAEDLDIAIELAAADNSALAKTEWNSDYSIVGHSDIIETTTGNGGNGGGLGDNTGAGDTQDSEGDSQHVNGTDQTDDAVDLLGQTEAHGGRGGHIDIQLGRLTAPQGGDTVTTVSLSLNGRKLENAADIGDTRAFLFNGDGALRLQGVQLIEGDIVVNSYGQVKLDSAVNNALSPANSPIVETVIGHGVRTFADSGDGGNGGEGNFNANKTAVFTSELNGENFLNYASGVGSNRGGNGGDIRITQGDITDRETRNNGTLSITHESDADSLDKANITLNIFDHLKDGTTDVNLADSLLINSSVNGGLSESTGADVISNVGHHVRIFGEGGIGGEGGSSNTEFDADGNSLYTNDAVVSSIFEVPDDYDLEDSGDGVQFFVRHETTHVRLNHGQLDTISGDDNELSDGVDETAIQAGAVYIQPNSSGGRGGDVLLVNNLIHGDIVVVAERRVTVQTLAGHGEHTKVFSVIGHTTDVVAVTQEGGNAGNLYEPSDLRASYDGGIINVNGTQVDENDGASSFAHVLIDGNQDDEFNQLGLDDADSTDGEDGIAVTVDDILNRRGSTIASINADLGTLIEAVTGADDGNGNNSDGFQTYVASAQDNVIFHDEEADPQFILDDDGTFVLNSESNNAIYAHNSGNLDRFGRTVATYDGEQRETTDGLFDATGKTAPNGTDVDAGKFALQVFVDMDLDGDVDLVDFDRDGRLDIVDVDGDGYMDVIDGRANYVNVSDTGAVPVAGGATNGISGLGVLDYVAVTGVGYAGNGNGLAGSLQNWSTERELVSYDLLDVYADDGGATSTDYVSLVSDFSTANGGRGGDAYTAVGTTTGNISVSTGDNDKGEATSLVVSVNLIDDVVSQDGYDYHIASIGHSAWQVSDTSADYADFRSGREGIDGATDTHGSADGGDAARYATNGHGGRGGNASTVQGYNNDLAEYDLSGNVVNIELDHLVGDIFINTFNSLDETYSNDAKQILVNSFVDTDFGHNNAIAQIGHNAEAFATAGKIDEAFATAGSISGNKGGKGESHYGPGEGPNGSSQTEIARGGDGGDAYIIQNQVKGGITVMTGADDGDGSEDFSVVIIAENGAAIVPGGPDNTIISQIGHGRRAYAQGGEGGNGDDGQLNGNGGDGGDAKVTQNDIIDTFITIDLVDTSAGFSRINEFYLGNGLSITANDFENKDGRVRAQVGHGDLAHAVGGKAGNGTPDWQVNEQRNQTANGGIGGDGIISQAGYNYDITLDIGYNSPGKNALEIKSSANTIFTGADNHILSTVGHGGYGYAESGAGGDAGLSGAVNGIQTAGDPNLVDADYNYFGETENGDTPYAIDTANSMVLGTDRRGGDAGNAIVDLNVGGTGRVIGNRNIEINVYGLDDNNGADINITLNDALSHANLEKTALRFGVGYDGVLIQTTTGPASNQDSSLYLNSALVGHHGFAETIAADGGDGIQSSLSALISEGDGGDGGTAITTIGAVDGDISISNVHSSTFIASADDSGNLWSTNITIESISGNVADTATHRGEARVGHMTHVAATGGAGGNASREAGAPPSFPAIISAQGGDGGDALTYQGQLSGNITLIAENSVNILATDTTLGGQMHVAAVGHRMEGRANAKVGGYGGTVVNSSQSIYFTYEALREFHARRTAGATDEDAYAALSDFEQKLVAPFVDYFENKGSEQTGEMEIFLDRLVGETANIIKYNERDDDYIGGGATGDFSIPALVDGNGLIIGEGDAEIQAMIAIMAASGHGGNATVVQGSIGLDGNTVDELSANGDITITAMAYDTTDATRGILAEAKSTSIGGSMEIVHIGHQAEAREIIAGDGQNLIGANANANGIGGDGGDAIIDQYAQNGDINLLSEHKIDINAIDASISAHEVRAWVGHRLTVGPDYTVYRNTYSAQAGVGGSETSDVFDDGHNGNGGDVFIYQRGVISGTQRADNDLDNDYYYGTEIALVALKDADDDQSIQILAESLPDGGSEVETHIGHDFLIHAVKAGDAGRQGSLTGPMGAEGLLEGNGGDIFIAQTDLGADIDIVGRDAVLIKVDTSLGGHGHLMIGHERTIGNDADTAFYKDGAVKDNPRTGNIIAGFGGDSDIEEVNGTALSSRVAAANGIIEDGDSGRIEIVLGKLGDSYESKDDNERLITITSITEDVDILSISALGSISILEIGNQQQVIAETLSASEYTGVPLVQTAGDAGGIFINRDDVYGDIVLQTLDADRSTAADGAARVGEGRQVVIDTVSGSGATSILQVGHETDFTTLTSNPLTKGGTARAAFGEDRETLSETNLVAFAGLAPAGTGGTGIAGEATLRDAQNAIEDMRNIVKALELAVENADRFPVSDGTNFDEQNDQSELFQLLDDARMVLEFAEAHLAAIGVSDTEAGAVNKVQNQAQSMRNVVYNFKSTLATIPGARDQIADFSEAGDIVYGALDRLSLDGKNHLNTHTSSITGIDALSITAERTINPTPRPGKLIAEGFDVVDTGVVRGDITVLAGRVATGVNVDSVVTDDSVLATIFGGVGGQGGDYTAADDLDDSVVSIGATSDALSLTELGHRRMMINTTKWGGGDTDGAPEAGGVAGDGGSIVTKNTTTGDISVQAEEVVIFATGAAGIAEVHLLHTADVINTAGWSDIQTKLGNGGDIINSSVVSGGVSINAEQFASAVDAQDRKILADGAADSFIHLGHQAEDLNESESDPNETGNMGDSQDNLGSNRGGFVNTKQTVSGNSDGDLVIITLDAAGDGNNADLIIETGGSGSGTIRLGNGEVGGDFQIRQTATSGINQSDDGSTIDMVQVVSGDIEISQVEDLEVNAISSGFNSIYIGHDAEQFGQSGQVNNPADILQYGERVTVSQTVTGDVNITTSSSFTAHLSVNANELHVGHEATQYAFSADDSANPSDLEDDGDNGTVENGIADHEGMNTEGPSAIGVNDNFNQPDVMATQIIEAGISIITGEITLQNDGAKGRLHFGHEAFHIAAVDGDLDDLFDGTNPAATTTSVANGSTGHVVASSIINGDGSDILFVANGATGQTDTVVVAVNGTQGDIQLDGRLGGDIQVGHRSTSTMGDVTPSLAPEGQFDALQAIGSFTLGPDGLVADTTQSVIEFRAAQDIILASVTGETQVGHYIVETGNPTSTTSPLNVDDIAATGLEEGDSELRQIVGSDIIFGDNTNQGLGGVGANGAGNNVIIETATGRTMIGHQSPDSNEWQVEAKARSVTVQLLDGDITVEAGTDAGVDAPDGTVLASAAAAIADESGLGDDLLILSGGGVARIGHNMAGADEGVSNETQRSAGDVWVRAGGDVHIIGGAVGHEHYDFTTLALSTLNATPESLAGSSIRDRIYGNTTIAAGQNSSAEDSTLIADILKIDGAVNPVEINSGYGGIGGRDVGGQLRFFLNAQEGLTIVPGVKFNDSEVAETPLAARMADAGNVFGAQGGLDHEHEFEFASTLAAYDDTFIGAANFGFYFETKSGGDFEFFTPYLTERFNDNGFELVYFDEDTGTRTAINIDSLADDYIGTSSLEVACEESGLTLEECNLIRERYVGQLTGVGSNTLFSGNAGGGQNLNIGLDDEFDPSLVTIDTENSYVIPNTVVYGQSALQQVVNEYGYVRPVTISNKSVSINPANVVVSNKVEYSKTILSQTINYERFTLNGSVAGSIVSKKFTITTRPRVNGYSGTVVYGDSFDMSSSYEGSASYGQYVEAGAINAYQQEIYPKALSFASSYIVFEEKNYN